MGFNNPACHQKRWTDRPLQGNARVVSYFHDQGQVIRHGPGLDLIARPATGLTEMGIEHSICMGSHLHRALGIPPGNLN